MTTAKMEKTKKTTKITTCKICDNVIEYKNRKPSYCKECRKGKGKINNHKFEKKIFNVIEKVIICDGIRNGYYTWLRSPKNEPMQLDWYCNCGIEIAFEIQGKQHYHFVKYFHRNKSGFEYQQICDAVKATKCRKRGVCLLKIPYDAKVDTFYILNLLDENGCLSELVRRGAINNRLLSLYLRNKNS